VTSELRWTFAVDAEGHARTFDERVAVETVTPGEYLVTLPSALAAGSGMEACIGDDAGFIAATPGDDAGNKPKTIRVLTMTRDNHFGPRPFTLVVSAV
jgi:hypothetical protein